MPPNMTKHAQLGSETSLFLKCLWKAVVPLEGGSTLCGLYFANVRSMSDHILIDHISARRNDEGKLVNDNKKWNCFWDDCRLLRGASMKLSNVCNHIGNHLCLAEEALPKQPGTNELVVVELPQKSVVSEELVINANFEHTVARARNRELLLVPADAGINVPPLLRQNVDIGQHTPASENIPQASSNITNFALIINVNVTQNQPPASLLKNEMVNIGRFAPQYNGALVERLRHFFHLGLETLLSLHLWTILWSTFTVLRLVIISGFAISLQLCPVVTVIWGSVCYGPLLRNWTTVCYTVPQNPICVLPYASKIMLWCNTSSLSASSTYTFHNDISIILSLSSSYTRTVIDETEGRINLPWAFTIQQAEMYELETLVMLSNFTQGDKLASLIGDYSNTASNVSRSFNNLDASAKAAIDDITIRLDGLKYALDLLGRGNWITRYLQPACAMFGLHCDLSINAYADTWAEYLDELVASIMALQEQAEGLRMQLDTGLHNQLQQMHGMIIVEKWAIEGELRKCTGWRKIFCDRTKIFHMETGLQTLSSLNDTRRTGVIMIQRLINDLEQIKSSAGVVQGRLKLPFSRGGVKGGPWIEFSSISSRPSRKILHDSQIDRVAESAKYLRHAKDELVEKQLEIGKQHMRNAEARMQGHLG